MTNPPDTLQIVDPDALAPSPPRKPRVDRFTLITWYFRGLWAIAILMIYLLVVELEMTGPIHSLLLAHGQLTANDTVIITPIRYPGQKFCEYITPQSVNATTFAFAAIPWHWGKALEAYLGQRYCNLTYAQLNIINTVDKSGIILPMPEPIGANGVVNWTYVNLTSSDIP